MHVEIVTHCWRYSRCLAYQLSSLIVWPPSLAAVESRSAGESKIDTGTPVTVDVRVFYSDEDRPTVEMLDFFAGVMRDATDVTLSPEKLPTSELLARNIGRNRAAITNNADLVWFADCDYFFGPGCIASLRPLLGRPELLFFPRCVWFNRNHALGDEMAARVTHPMVVMSNRRDRPDHLPTGPCGMGESPGGWVLDRPRRAIGGIQIVPGAVAKRGYAPDAAKHLRPAPEGCKTFQRCRGDVPFRRQLGTRGTPVDILNVYRIRQTRRCYVDDPLPS